ncbi:hypothetical protein BC628DRAFT_1340035 [Trametes gibbosa]|nr:hypothetical protein BC628DRAFT_1340035 [Trametes gibbosa]
MGGVLPPMLGLCNALMLCLALSVPSSDYLHRFSFPSSDSTTHTSGNANISSRPVRHRTEPMEPRRSGSVHLRMEMPVSIQPWGIARRRPAVPSVVDSEVRGRGGERRQLGEPSAVRSKCSVADAFELRSNLASRGLLLPLPLPGRRNGRDVPA